MFSYKAAVAVKKLGFDNVRIYNGGIKDWKKSGYPLEYRQSLPEINIEMIDTEAFYRLLRDSEPLQCLDATGAALVSILDFRNSNHFDKDPPLQIDTSCPVQRFLLDDIMREEIRSNIPKEGLVVTVTETGNRDEFVLRYLSQYGFNNVKALRFGMRGWLKQRYPTR